MQIKFLGTGGAFDYEYGNSALTVDMDQRILLDCGPSVFPSLMEKKLIKTIDYLLLTHLHGDHVGSLFQIAYYFKIFLNRKLKILVATTQFRAEIIALLNSLGVPDQAYELLDLNAVSGIIAIETTGKHAKNVTSFGYVFRHNNTTVYYSGDLGDVSVSRDFLQNCTDKNLTVFHEMSWNKGPAHTSYDELGQLLKYAPIFAYHLNPNLEPKDNTVPLVHSHPEYLW